MPSLGRLVPLLAVACAGCGSGSADGGAAEPAGIDVIAAFYPLQFVAERVGGDLVSVANVTPAGAEPHDLELTAHDVASLQDADLLVYLSGFSPAIDDAAADLAAERTFDVASVAELTIESDEEHADEDEHADDEDREHEGADPHFWLDPIRLAGVADALADRFATSQPDGADTFRENAAEVRADLEQLDAELTAGLADCAITDMVTSHTAFAYLADRYGFAQLGISGVSPDEEPSPGSLAEITEFVREQGITTIYYETLVDPAIAETVAAETGAATAVLDPLEGLTAESAGSDYVEVMRSNLEALRAGQGCT